MFPQPLLDALAAPGPPAFEHGSRVVSRAEVLAMVRRLAAGLRDAGLGQASGVAMVTSVSPEAFAAHLAAHAIGCRVVAIRPGWTTAQLAHALGDRVDAVVADSSTATPELVSLAGTAPLLSLDSLLTSPDDGLPVAPAGRPGDIARLTFTSGSTGLPKACAHSYRAFSEDCMLDPGLWTADIAALAAGFERGLVYGTLASSVIMTFAAVTLLGGGTAVIPEEPNFPWVLEEHRITGVIVTVPRLHLILDTLASRPVDVSSLRALVVAGSPITPRRLAAAAQRLGPVVYQGYGQTEVGLISLLTPRDIAEHPASLASVGRPHPSVEISMRSGEVYLRCPYRMDGIWGDPWESADLLRDGWVRTRDLGYLDEDGFLHLTGRTRDAIMVYGEVVYAGPIERVLASHPDVDQAYVAGAPDERSGEAVHAFVVASGDRVPDREVLAKHVLDDLGASHVPKTITVVPGVPVAAGGKPDKRALLAAYHRQIGHQSPP